MIKLTTQGKYIDTKSIEHLFTQGEKYSDIINIVLNTKNNGMDISDCIFVLRTVASEGSMTETILHKTILNEQILLMWQVSDTATAVPGMLRLELIGSKETETIIKFKMPPIYVKEAIMGSNIPVPDLVDEKLIHMNEILEKISELTKQLAGENGIVNEVINARKGSLSEHIYNNLSQRLAAEFSACVQKSTLESTIDSLIKQSNIITVDSELSSTSTNPVQNKIIKAALDSKANSEHTHNYLPLSGNAQTATKLQTARKINGIAFDGEKDITIPVNGCYAYDNTATATTDSWHKIASRTLTTANDDAYAIFHVYRTMSDTPCGGVLKAHIRTSSTGLHYSSQLSWEYASSSIRAENFVLVSVNDEENKSTTVELWMKSATRYIGWQFTLIAESNRTSTRHGLWTLYNSGSGQESYTEGDVITVSDLTEIQNTNTIFDSGWISIVNGEKGDVRYRKYGKQVEIRGEFKPDVTSDGFTIGQLPEGYRPSSFNANGVFCIDSCTRFYKIVVYTDGRIVISGGTEYLFAANQSYFLHLCFLVD